ncbi:MULTISPECIES: aminotransferase class V-fold PLP-dependent enzyme [unclassified Sphingopyxis]|uniref:aminotransferase class V-fold PLP-dependent enzyme n=1 Tax=unclassified Sphingopyxis TaxID=2614943 RepID=UPI0024AD4704|nr:MULTISPECIES: aminotransferase class V-fold PLP-dependent enzyme [unclassified Sphingopyxis]
MPNLSCRALFDIPDDVAYFNTAYNAPLLRASRDALVCAAGAKLRPWERAPADFFADAETLRGVSAALFGTAAENFAIVPAASYGISTAARILEPRLQAGDHILVAAQEFPSNIFPWQRIAAERGAAIRTAGRPVDGDWTRAVLAALDPSVRIAALSACHWTDGATFDLVAIGAACRANGTVLVLDVTQSLGAAPLDLAAVRPDFMVAAGYKWLLCPYGFSLLYVDPRWHGERPLEESWLARSNAQDFTRLADYCAEYRSGARRYDVGETCVTTVLPGAIAALRQIEQWGIAGIVARLGAITDRIAAAVAPLGYEILAPHFRSRHILGLSVAGDPQDLIGLLRARNIHVSQRGDAIRIAPHLHVTDSDVDRLIEALAGD